MDKALRYLTGLISHLFWQSGLARTCTGFEAGVGGAGTSLVTPGLAIANEEHSPNEMHSRIKFT